jgi:hypothetical protein
VDRGCDAKYQRVRSAYREVTEWMATFEWVRLDEKGLLRMEAKTDPPTILPDP